MVNTFTELAKNSISSHEYENIHMWLRRKYGLANKCEGKNCKKESKRIEWALINGKEYGRDRDNFMMLCVKCHRLYDGIPDKMRKISTGRKHSLETRLKWSKMRKGRKAVVRREVTCITETKNIMFPSITKAAKQMKTSKSAISNVFSGRAKTAGGYKWKMGKKIYGQNNP